MPEAIPSKQTATDDFAARIKGMVGDAQIQEIKDKIANAGSPPYSATGEVHIAGDRLSVRIDVASPQKKFKGNCKFYPDGKPLNGTYPLGGEICTDDIQAMYDNTTIFVISTYPEDLRVLFVDNNIKLLGYLPAVPIQPYISSSGGKGSWE